MAKICKSCGADDLSVDFGTYNSICRKCYKRDYFQKNKEKIAHQNKQRYSNKDVIFIKECPVCYTKFSISRSDKKTCSTACSNRLWRAANKEKLNKSFKNRYHSDIHRKLATCLRSRLNKALKGAYKSSSYSDYIGCTPEQLKNHLESLFKPGMTWDNYGIRGWHIDHIRPLDSYNLSDPSELLEACNYKNLQPLWAKDNLTKGCKYE